MSNLHGLQYECNENAINRISPHLLTYVQEPRSQLLSLCNNLGNSKTNSHELYLQAHKRKREELRGIANKISRNYAEGQGPLQHGESGVTPMR